MTAVDVFEAVGNETIKELKKGLDKSNASFNLTQSIDYNVLVSKDKIVFSLTMDGYYHFVDKGRKVGRYAPVEAIRGYVTNKGLKLKERVKKKDTALKPKTSSKTKNVIKRAKSGLAQSIKDRNTLAFLINRKLKNKGYKGNNFYSKVINNTWVEDLTSRLAEAGVSEIDLEFDLLISGT